MVRNRPVFAQTVTYTVYRLTFILIIHLLCHTNEVDAVLYIIVYKIIKLFLLMCLMCVCIKHVAHSGNPR